MLTIRKARITDCPAMMGLLQELASYEKQADAITVSLAAFIDAGFGTQPVWEAYVAEKDEQLIGLSLFYKRYSTWKGLRLYLEDLIVTETERGSGVGKMLLDQTIEHAKTHQYSGMMWHVLDWNETAINFYKKYPCHFDDEWVNVSLNFND